MSGRVVTLLVKTGGGLFIVALGVASLILALPLEWGTLARMGPGFMPVALSLLVVGIGTAIVVTDLRAGDDTALRLRPLWRPFVLVLASVAVFGLLIERAGLVPAIAASVIVAAPAERAQRPLEVAGLIVGLSVFCATPLRRPPGHDDQADLSCGGRRRHRDRSRSGDHTDKPTLLPDRRAPGHAGRRSARHRTDLNDGRAPSAHVHAAGRRRPHHARGHLLRRAIRWLNHRDSRQPAGRELCGRDLHRWSSDGTSGPRRSRAGDGRARIAVCGLRRHARQSRSSRRR